MLKLKNKGPKACAEAFKKYITKNFDVNENSVVVWSPEEAINYTSSKAWVVSWEEGPFEWAQSVLGGCSFYDFEHGKYSGSYQAVNTDEANCSPECLNGFQIGFFKL